MSRPAAGSSRKSSSGLPHRASANRTRWRWPPDNWPNNLFSSPPRAAAATVSARGRRGVVTREQLDVLAHAQHFRRPARLAAWPRSEAAPRAAATLAEQGNLSGTGGGQAEQQADQRGLPGSVRAEQGPQLATADRQVDPAQRPNRSVLLHDARVFRDHCLSHASHVEATPALPVVPEVSPVRWTIVMGAKGVARPGLGYNLSLRL